MKVSGSDVSERDKLIVKIQERVNGIFKKECGVNEKAQRLAALVLNSAADAEMVSEIIIKYVSTYRPEGFTLLCVTIPTGSIGSHLSTADKCNKRCEGCSSGGQKL